MWEFVNEMPPGVLKTMFQILSGIALVANTIWKYLFTDLSTILTNIIEEINLPQWLINMVDWLLDTPAAWIYQLSLFEILFGLGLVVVLIFGIVKFFTDIVL